MKRSILMIVGILLLLGGGAVYYVYNKPHRNVEAEEASISISSVELFNKYSENEKQSDSTYLNQVVKVTGVISEMDRDQKGERFVVMKEEDDIFGVFCTLDESDPENRKKAEALQVGDSIALKGICTGFADDVKLNKCVLLKP